MTDTSARDRSAWRDELDRLTKNHEGQWVTIELLDPTLGDLEEAERLPFTYATYDPRDDAVIVAVGGRSGRFPVVLRHIVNHPTEVDVSDDGRGLAAMRVVDADGTATLVSFVPEPALA